MGVGLQEWEEVVFQPRYGSHKGFFRQALHRSRPIAVRQKAIASGGLPARARSRDTIRKGSHAFPAFFLRFVNELHPVEEIDPSTDIEIDALSINKRNTQGIGEIGVRG